MSPEATMIGNTLDAIGRVLAQAGPEGPNRPALAPYARVLSIGTGAIRSEAAMAEIGARAAAGRAGMRWIVPPAERERTRDIDGLCRKAATTLERLSGGAADGLCRTAAVPGGASIRPAPGSAASRHCRPGTCQRQALPVLLALLAFAIGSAR